MPDYLRHTFFLLIHLWENKGVIVAEWPAKVRSLF